METPARKKAILWGATGQALVLEEILRREFDIIALFDREPVRSPIPQVPVFRGIAGFEEWKSGYSGVWQDIGFVVAIGGDRGQDRLEIHYRLRADGLQPINVVHPTAFVAYNAEISEGVQILANSSVCVGVKLGVSVIINTAATVDHESLIGDGVHIGPGAKLAGCVEVGNNTFIGTGAVVLPRIKIGANCVVGAGAVVNKDLPDNVIAFGNPCRIRRANHKNG